MQHAFMRLLDSRDLPVVGFPWCAHYRLMVSAGTAVCICLSSCEEGLDFLCEWDGVLVALAALQLRCTVWIFTHQFTLRLGTLRLVALPGTRYFLTNHLTLRSRRFAVSHTVRLLTVRKALRTVRGNAGLFRTLDLTVRLGTAHVAESAVRGCAGGVAGWGFADRQTQSRTLRTVALPGTLREAVLGRGQR